MKTKNINLTNIKPLKPLLTITEVKQSQREALIKARGYQNDRIKKGFVLVAFANDGQPTQAFVKWSAAQQWAVEQSKSKRIPKSFRMSITKHISGFSTRSFGFRWAYIQEEDAVAKPERTRTAAERLGISKEATTVREKKAAAIKLDEALGYKRLEEFDSSNRSTFVFFTVAHSKGWWAIFNRKLSDADKQIIIKDILEHHKKNYIKTTDEIKTLNDRSHVTSFIGGHAIITIVAYDNHRHNYVALGMRLK